MKFVGAHEVVINLWLIILAGGIFLPVTMLISHTERISLFAKLGPIALAWIYINHIRIELGFVNCYVALEW